jgi:glycosyltransferase involved in cell wall biosynthesis
MCAKIHFICNSVFSTSITGGDVHFLKLAEFAAKADYELNFFGGTALREIIERHKLPGAVTLTDNAIMPKMNRGAFGGQFAMFRDFQRRYRRTLRLLHQIAPDDFVYAVSDYWFDVLPAVSCPARRKLMVLHMEAPKLGQIVTRSRPDVDPLRLASLHYWASQEWSLHRFARCKTKRLFYLHPLMEPRLRKLGVRDKEMTRLSYGLDIAAMDAVPAQARVYDAIWIGRVHRQKGIDDLLATLTYLAQRLENFHAVLVGNVRDDLLPGVNALGLGKNVTFTGFVSEEEKIRLFKSSRVFLMPSKHEGSPRVIGESIIAGTPVVAYEIPNYRPLFGDFIRYAPPFNLEAFQQTAERKIQEMRIGKSHLDPGALADFKRQNLWETTQTKFVQTLEGLRC